MPAHVLKLWLKRAHRGPMDPVPEAFLDLEQGVVGSVDRSRRRQVTIVSREAWGDALAELGATVDPIARRANILVSGIDLENSRDRILRIGQCRLKIGGETRPCERMEEAAPGLQRALDPHWRAGVFAQVLEAGSVRLGDSVEFEPLPEL